jgi:nitroreductase
VSLLDTILSRRSVRKYGKKKVSKKVLNRILEAGRQAPSASNKQPWHFIVVTDKEIKEKLSYGKSNSFITDSAFTLVGCKYVGDDYSRKWSTVDTSIALQNMVIAAWSLGVGSCWIGAFKEDEIKQILDIPDDWKVVSLVSFGYPAEPIGKKEKKSIKEIIGYNKF